MLYYYKVRRRRRYRIKELFLLCCALTLVWAYFSPGSFSNFVSEIEVPSLSSLPLNEILDAGGNGQRGTEMPEGASKNIITLSRANSIKTALQQEGKRRESLELGYSIDLINKLDKGDRASKTRVSIMKQAIDRTARYFMAGNTTSDKIEILNNYGGGNLAYVYYPNYGVHFNPVTTANIGLDQYHKGNYKMVVRTTDELIAQAIEKQHPKAGSYYVWEYYFDLEFGEQKFAAPWHSGMAQGLALNLIGKSYSITHDKKYLKAGELVLNSFNIPWDEGGVTDYDKHGNWYLEVAATDKIKILNGFLLTLEGLHDYYKRTGDDRALGLFYAGVSEAKAHLKEYDLGYWSNYSLVKGNKASYHYHKIHVTLLDQLYKATKEPVFKEYTDIFNSYLKYHFIDIPKEHRSYEAITALTKRGIMTSDNGWFAPNNATTKADFAIWLCRVKKWPPNVIFNGYYRDIGRDRPYWGYLEALKERGVDLGDEDGLFWPDRHITRAGAAVMLSSIYDTTVNGNPIMRDVPGNHLYYEEISVAVSNNLMSLSEPYYFRPDAKLTHEQAAHILYKLMNR